MTRGFASDNNAGVHPKIMEAIISANTGHVVAYGDDLFTDLVSADKFAEHFGDAQVFFVFNGTGANVLGLQAMTSPFNAIICSAVAHISADECGAPGKFTGGCTLLPIPTKDGKITVEQIKQNLQGIGDQHHIQAKAVSITQATEYGTVYSIEEILAITSFAHERGMHVHMDGARLANAAVYLGATLQELTRLADIDVLSFGGTKNGMMYGEAVVIFNRSLAENFKYLRKQGAQLASKMRFISAQFAALLSDDLWWKNARHANEMARFLADELNTIPEVSITQRVQANAVFVKIPRDVIPTLQSSYFFYVWNEEENEIRLMASFDTTADDIKEFIALLKKLLRSLTA